MSQVVDVAKPKVVVFVRLLVENRIFFPPGCHMLLCWKSRTVVRQKRLNNEKNQGTE